MDVLVRLADLYLQASQDRSQFYTALVLRDAIAEINRLWEANAELQAKLKRKLPRERSLPAKSERV
jgi:hypothetical protein